MRPLLTRLSRLWKRPWLLLAVLLALGACAFAGLHVWAWYHFSAGRAALEAYHTPEARDHLGRALRVWPGSVEGHLLAARAARRAGDFAAAERHLDDCRRLAGAQLPPDVALEWALLQVSMGELNPAEEALQQRLEKDPTLAPLVWEAFAEGYRRLARTRDALDCVENWLARQPENVEALFQRAQVHWLAGGQQKAAEDYRRVVERDPARDDARRRLASCLVQVGRYSEAFGHLEILRRKHPEDLELLVADARCRHYLGQSAEAARLLDGALAADPRNGQALRERGRLELEAGRSAAAEPFLRRAVEVSPRDYQTVWALHDCLRQQGKTAEADTQLALVQRLKDAIERINEIKRREMAERPSDAALHCEFGTLLMRVGDAASAERWLLSALRLEPANRAAHAALAELYRETGDAERAAFHRRAVAVSPP